jgi:hypothetical protein
MGSMFESFSSAGRGSNPVRATSAVRDLTRQVAKLKEDLLVYKNETQRRENSRDVIATNRHMVSRTEKQLRAAEAELRNLQ